MDPRSRPDDGFTIIEVIVASTVLVGALLAAAAMFSNAIVVSGNTRNRVVAANLATAQMESVRGLASDPTQFASIPQGLTTLKTAAQLVNGVQYSVKQNVQFVSQSSTQSSCDSPGNTSGQIMQVSESVTWTGMAGTKPVKEVTTLAPPVGVYSASSGSIAAKVYDSTGAASENVTVQVNGPDSATQQTTSEGCAYFAYLDPGAYTVTVVGTGVGDQEVAAPAQNASVSVGQTVSVQFQYDSPATITATFPTTPAPATGMSLSVANTGLQPYGQFSFATSYTAGATVTSPGLFPYASGYTMFAGNCTDNNPLGKDTSHNTLYPTAAPPVITVTPNGTASAGTVPLYSVAVHVQNSSSPTPVAVANTTPTAAETTSYPSPYTAQCTNGTATGTAPTLGLVTTNTTGDSTTLLPLGHWTITATCTKPATPCPTANKVGSTPVWVKPDGVYQVNNATGASTTKFPAAVTVVVNFIRAYRRLRAHRAETGTTLIEMMIVTMLLSVVVSAAFGVVIVMQNQAVSATDRFSAQDEAQTIADRLTKDIRTAVAPNSTTAAFASADANDMVFYAQLSDIATAGNGPTRVHAYAALKPATTVYAFHEDVTPPDSGGSSGNYTYSGTAVNRIDGQYIDVSQPMFSYYQADGTQILPMPIVGVTNLRSIDSVGVTLRIRVHPKSPTVVISTRIHVRNVDYNPSD